jgi:hypothetical protein
LSLLRRLLTRRKGAQECNHFRSTVSGRAVIEQQLSGTRNAEACMENAIKDIKPQEAEGLAMRRLSGTRRGQRLACDAKATNEEIAAADISRCSATYARYPRVNSAQTQSRRACWYIQTNNKQKPNK